MIYWIFIIGILGYMVYGIFCAYQDAKMSADEDALHNFWRYFGIGVIFFLVVCSYFGYDYVNKNNRHHRYHNSETGREQIQYQGSQEQQLDLKAIDDYASKDKNF